MVLKTTTKPNLSGHTLKSYLSVVEISNNSPNPLSTLLKFCGIVCTHSASKQLQSSLDVGSEPVPQLAASQFSSHDNSVLDSSPTSFGYVTKFNFSGVNEFPWHL